MIERASEESKKFTFISPENLPKFDAWKKIDVSLTVGVVTYSQNFLLKTLINSFEAQSDPSWKMVILHDGPISAVLYEDLLNNGYLKSKKIILLTTDTRYNDYGHFFADNKLTYINPPHREVGFLHYIINLVWLKHVPPIM